MYIINLKRNGVTHSIPYPRKLFSSAFCGLYICVRGVFVGRREGDSLGQFLPDDLISFVKKEVASSAVRGWASGTLESLTDSQGEQKRVPCGASSVPPAQPCHTLDIFVENYQVLSVSWA